VIACDRKENLMKLLSSKEIIVSANEKIATDFVTKLSNLTTKFLAQDKISITYDPEKIEVGKILQIIYDAKINIRDISTQQPDLEEIFKHLIAKK
jgi:ABC-2 type transport system ATP-binding protein